MAFSTFYTYLMTFITFEHLDNPGQRNMDILYFIFNKLNIPMALHTTSGPCTVMVYLGIILDSCLMGARLPNDKLVRIIGFLNVFLNRKSCSKRELLQLLGHLNFASRVVLPGRSFVSYLISLSTTVKSLHHHVKLNVQCREDTQMWLMFLSNWNGVNLFYNSDISSIDMKLSTDASASLGYGGYFEGKFFSETWPSKFESLVSNCNEISIAFRELYPIVVAAILWGYLWKRQPIEFMCDNRGFKVGRYPVLLPV